MVHPFRRVVGLCRRAPTSPRLLCQHATLAAFFGLFPIKLLRPTAAGAFATIAYGPGLSPCVAAWSQYPGPLFTEVEST